jgi:hypothetical protein
MWYCVHVCACVCVTLLWCLCYNAGILVLYGQYAWVILQVCLCYTASMLVLYCRYACVILLVCLGYTAGMLVLYCQYAWFILQVCLCYTASLLGLYCMYAPNKQHVCVCVCVYCSFVRSLLRIFLSFLTCVCHTTAVCLSEYTRVYLLYLLYTAYVLTLHCVYRTPIKNTWFYFSFRKEFHKHV